MIYLASPHTHKSPRVEESREDAVNTLTAALLANGVPVFSPIVYSMTLREHIGHDFAAWKRFDLAMVDVCLEFWIADLDGWNVSVGIAHEVLHFCQKNLRPVWAPRLLDHRGLWDHYNTGEIAPLDLTDLRAGFTTRLLPGRHEDFARLVAREHRGITA